MSPSLKTNPMVYIISVLILIIGVVLFSNSESIAAMVGYETRGALIQKLKERDSQLQTLTNINRELVAKIEQVKDDERAACNVSINVKQQEMALTQLQTSIENKTVIDRGAILEAASKRLLEKVNKHKEGVIPVERNVAKTVVVNKSRVNQPAKNTPSIPNDRLTDEELNKLSTVNIVSINEYYIKAITSAKSNNNQTLKPDSKLFSDPTTQPTLDIATNSKNSTPTPLKATHNQLTTHLT